MANYFLDSPIPAGLDADLNSILTDIGSYIRFNFPAIDFEQRYYTSSDSYELYGKGSLLISADDGLSFLSVEGSFALKRDTIFDNAIYGGINIGTGAKRLAFELYNSVDSSGSGAVGSGNLELIQITNDQGESWIGLEATDLSLILDVDLLSMSISDGTVTVNTYKQGPSAPPKGKIDWNSGNDGEVSIGNSFSADVHTIDPEADFIVSGRATIEAEDLLTVDGNFALKREQLSTTDARYQGQFGNATLLSLELDASVDATTGLGVPGSGHLELLQIRNDAGDSWLGLEASDLDLTLNVDPLSMEISDGTVNLNTASAGKQKVDWSTNAFNSNTIDADHVVNLDIGQSVDLIYSSQATNIISGSVTVAQANSIAAQTSGVVTATIIETDMATLAGLIETGNAYTITVNDASVDAAALSALDAKTTVTVNAAAVGTLTGTAAGIATAISANTIDTATNVGVTVSSGSAAASDLNTIDTNTTAVVDASAVTTITGLVADVKTAIASAGITTATNYAAILTDAEVSVSDANTVDADTTGVLTATITSGTVSTLNDLTGTGNSYTLTVNDSSVSAADLNALDAKSTVAVNAAAVTALTGTAADVKGSYASSGISGLGNETVTLSGSTSVADANSVSGRTSGVITATISEGDLTTLGALTGSGNAYTVTLSDTSADASALITLDSKTTVAVNAASLTSLTGTTADALTAYNSSGISGLGTEAVTISDTTLAAVPAFTATSQRWARRSAAPSKPAR